MAYRKSKQQLVYRPSQMGRLSIEGQPDDSEQTGETVLTFGVTPAYFSVFGISLVDGRTFDSSDRLDVAIYGAYRQSRLDWVYLPLNQLHARSLYVVFRGPSSPVEATAQLQFATWELEPNQPVGGTVAGDGAAILMDILKYIRTIFETARILALLGGLGALLVASIGL